MGLRWRQHQKDMSLNNSMFLPSSNFYCVEQCKFHFCFLAQEAVQIRAGGGLFWSRKMILCPHLLWTFYKHIERTNCGPVPHTHFIHNMIPCTREILTDELDATLGTKIWINAFFGNGFLKLSFTYHIQAKVLCS